MLYTVRVLKRKDAASVVVAVILAMLTVNILPTFMNYVAERIAYAGDAYMDTGYYRPGLSGAAGHNPYLVLALSFLLQLLAVEVGLRLFIWTRNHLVRRNAPAKRK